MLWMTFTVADRAELLERAGLSAAEARAWIGSAPAGADSFPGASAALSQFLTRGSALVGRLPARERRTEEERAAREAIVELLGDARELYLRAHASELYDILTADRTNSVRIEELVYAAAERVPGLVPSRAEIDAERERRLAEKEGVELDQGRLLAHILGSPRAGRHLLGAMLEPTAEALERLERFQATGEADLGPVRVTRRGRAGFLELSNPRHLNAEDGVTLAPTERGVDLILLDPAIEVGVFRGAVVDQRPYAGERVFGAGINLTHLYYGRIDFLFYLIRDLGYVNKIYRGIRDRGIRDRGIRTREGAAVNAPEYGAGEETTEKLWIAAVEKFAIGGHCQLLHVVDHVIATRGSRLYLPARKEGIIPGASNLRLPRFVGDRAARQAILSGREWTAGEPDADLLCDEVVEPAEIDHALEARIEALTSSGLINATANRSVLRIGQEPLDLFREYMAMYAREQAYCHLSPALVRNLEQHWNAHRRTI
jgi:(3,5-dihydroxyphenyl)acetyl-CoA 1,2-dioxygenase